MNANATSPRVVDTAASAGHGRQSRADKTPADLTITPRDRRFVRSGLGGRWWLNNNPYATALFNALSVTFPKGEAFFVESVKAHREGVPPRLAGEIAAFVKQEVIHSREHVVFNRHVVDQGYDISLLEEDVDKALALTKGRPPIANLAATMALEHFTAILAHELLNNPAYLQGASGETGQMWRWHALEEVEHKGVAYDTWLFATRDWPRGKRWRVKSKVMLITTWNFFRGRIKGSMELLRQDGITGPRAWFGFLWNAFGSPGIYRRIMGQWFAFFLPGFHPWNHDDRALIAREESDYAAAIMPRAV